MFSVCKAGDQFFIRIIQYYLTSFTVLGFSKLLICGGAYPFTSTCEVINLQSSTTICKTPPNFPKPLSAAVGGMGFHKNPIICGGYQNTTHSNMCYSLENNDWVSFVSMNSVRIYAETTQLQDGRLLVTGGFSPYLSSSEMSSDVGWDTNIPILPVTVYSHSMITVNSTTVMVIGGAQNGPISGKTFYLTLGAKSWTEGPTLKYLRYYHSCGKIIRDKTSQEMSIIVASGNNGSAYLSSVEILIEGSKEWETGPELPFGIWAAQMVEDQNGGVVLIGGQSSSSLFHDTLYQLPNGGQDAVWTKMEQRMKLRRYKHTAIMVPDNIVDCY